MQKFFKIILGLGLVLFGLFLIMRQPAGDTAMEKQKPDFAIEAADLYRQFSIDESAANGQYLNKIILVTGRVSSSGRDDRGYSWVALETSDPSNSVKCRLDSKILHRRTNFQNGEKISLKGVCTGYTGDVGLTQCVEQ